MSIYVCVCLCVCWTRNGRQCYLSHRAIRTFRITKQMRCECNKKKHSYVCLNTRVCVCWCVSEIYVYRYCVQCMPSFLAWLRFAYLTSQQNTKCCPHIFLQIHVMHCAKSGGRVDDIKHNVGFNLRVTIISVLGCVSNRSNLYIPRLLINFCFNILRC